MATLEPLDRPASLDLLVVLVPPGRPGRAEIREVLEIPERAVGTVPWE